MQQRDKIKPILFSIIKHSTPEELKKQIPRDIVAGIVVAIVALPLSIALGIASGVSPEQGLYTAIIAGFLIAFLGGSRVQISGPTAAFATIVAGIVATDGMEGLIVATIIAIQLNWSSVKCIHCIFQVADIYNTNTFTIQSSIDFHHQLIFSSVIVQWLIFITISCSSTLVRHFNPSCTIVHS